jgi:hypothetical protein
VNMDEATLRTLVRNALEMAADDHTLLAWLAAEMRRGVPTLTDAEVKDLTIAVVRALLDNGLVQAGIPDGSGFRPEQTTSQELARRIASRWHLAAADNDDVQYSLWLSATSSGEALAKGDINGDMLESTVAAAGRALTGEASG